MSRYSLGSITDMNRIEQLLAEMTKAERDAPATNRQLYEFIAHLSKHMKELNRRIKELEKGAHP